MRHLAIIMIGGKEIKTGLIDKNPGTNKNHIHTEKRQEAMRMAHLNGKKMVMNHGEKIKGIGRMDVIYQWTLLM